MDFGMTWLNQMSVNLQPVSSSNHQGQHLLNRRYVYAFVIKISWYQLDSLLYSELKQLRSCPGDGSCSNHGRCDTTVGSCICNPGFEGTQCEG